MILDNGFKEQINVWNTGNGSNKHMNILRNFIIFHIENIKIGAVPVKRIKLFYYFSIVLLVAAGILFVVSNRYGRVVKVMENLKDKHVVFYSSNFKRMYLDSSGGPMKDMEKLTAEGTEKLKKKGYDSIQIRVEEGNADPYSQSGIYLERDLKSGIKCILIDLSRAQSKFGSKYKLGDVTACPIVITVSKSSRSYGDSLLFAGRIKYAIADKYKDLPVRIVESNEGDYNQSRGYIGLLVEIGDAENTFKEAERSLNIFCDAVIGVIGSSN